MLIKLYSLLQTMMSNQEVVVVDVHNDKTYAKGSVFHVSNICDVGLRCSEVRGMEIKKQ